MSETGNERLIKNFEFRGISFVTHEFHGPWETKDGICRGCGVSFFTVELEPPVDKRRLALAILARRAAPGYSWCYRCTMPWKFTKSHTTQYTNNKGCFPLCEECWSTLTIEQRVPYYEMLFARWEQDQPMEEGEKQAILNAVRSGL
jgi:hypothetical protein